MEKKKITFISDPSIKQLLLVSVIWIVGTGLLLCAATDFLQKPFVLKDNFLYLFLIIPSTSVVVEMYLNFFRPQKT